METEIEYEQVTIRLPKVVLDFLRSMEKTISMTPKEYIEYNTVCSIRADIDDLDAFVPSPEEVAKAWNLNPIFKQILNDPFKDC
jgi:hypothetical protein